MINRLQTYYSFIYSLNQTKNYKGTNKLMWFICSSIIYLLSRLILWLINCRCRCHNKPKRLNPKGHITVSLTTFPARIKKLHLVLDCLFHQTYMPNRIVLWLSREEFTEGYDSLPENLRKYTDYGLEIKFCQNNLKPHNKYFYTFLEEEANDVVTVDDDLLYRSDLLERLKGINQDYPSLICANNGRIIDYEHGSFGAYSKWIDIKSQGDVVGHEILACGYGGVYYPFTFIKGFRETLCNKESIIETSLRADDLWLKANEILAGIEVCVRSYYPHPITIPTTSASALSNTNRNNGATGNDDQWSHINNKFNLSKYLENK